MRVAGLFHEGTSVLVDVETEAPEPESEAPLHSLSHFKFQLKQTNPVALREAIEEAAAELDDGREMKAQPPAKSSASSMLDDEREREEGGRVVKERDRTSKPQPSTHITSRSNINQGGLFLTVSSEAN